MKKLEIVGWVVFWVALVFFIGREVYLYVAMDERGQFLWRHNFSRGGALLVMIAYWLYRKHRSK